MREQDGHERVQRRSQLQAQAADMTGDLDHGDSLEAFDEDKDWLTMSLGGPILRDRLFFYGFYEFNWEGRAGATSCTSPASRGKRGIPTCIAT